MFVFVLCLMRINLDLLLLYKCRYFRKTIQIRFMFRIGAHRQTPVICRTIIVGLEPYYYGDTAVH